MYRNHIEKGINHQSPKIEPNWLQLGALKIDGVLASDTETPASLVLPLSRNIKKSVTRATQRIGSFGVGVAETLSAAVTVWGLSSEAPWVNVGEVKIPVVAVVGLLSEVVSNLAKGELLNRLGAGQKVDILDVLTQIQPFLPQINSSLLQAGFTEDQVRSLRSLPDNIYNKIFGTTLRTRVDQFLKPLATGMVMASYGDVVSGSIVGGIGIAGLSMGEMMYQHSLRTKRKLEAGRSAEDADFVMQAYEQDHIPRTRAINLLSKLPGLATALSLVTGAQERLSNFAGFSTGLSGLVNLLSSTRSRVENQDMTSLVKRIFTTLANPYYLILPGNFKGHAESHGSPSLDTSTNFSGLVVRNVDVGLADGTVLISNLSFEARSGEVLLIEGSSGKGKSQLYGVIAKVTDGGERGQVALVDNGSQTNLNEFAVFENPTEEISQRILVGGVNHLNNFEQIVDLFKDSFNSTYEIPDELSGEDRINFVRGMKMANNLLAKELAIWNHPKKVGTWPLKSKEKTIFNQKVMSALSLYNAQRFDWVSNLLHNQSLESNLNKAEVHPGRTVDNLSDGQKSNIMLLSILEKVRSNPLVEVVLLDEPVRGLDQEVNLQVAMKIINEIRKTRNGIAVCVISQDKIVELRETFHSNTLDVNTGLVSDFVEKVTLIDESTPYALALNGMGIDLNKINEHGVESLWQQILEMDPFSREVGKRYLSSLSKNSILSSNWEIVGNRNEVGIVKSFAKYWANIFRDFKRGVIEGDVWTTFEDQLRILWKYIPIIEPEYERNQIEVIRYFSEQIAEITGIGDYNFMAEFDSVSLDLNGRALIAEIGQHELDVKGYFDTNIETIRSFTYLSVADNV